METVKPTQLAKAPAGSFKIGDLVMYEGWLWVFEGYIGKTGKMAQIARKQHDGDGYPVRRVYVKSLTDANETRVLLEGCDMCYAQARLQGAMACIEAIPDFDIALFDDPITLAFEWLEIAFSALTHYPHEEAS